jgi:cellulase/cellobiase CelA1
VEQQQLVTNRGFETNTSGWAGAYGASISSSSVQAYSGGRSLRAGNRTQTYQGAEYNLLGAAFAGETLDATLRARIGGASSDSVLFTLRYACQGQAVDWITVAAGTATNLGWVQLSGSVEVPNCPLTELAIYAEGPSPNVVLYVDDVSITRTVDACQASSQPLLSYFSVPNDWGSGYCVDLHMTNPGSAATSNWSATFNLNGTNITGIWNLQPTGYSGIVTVAPMEPWSKVIEPGHTSHSLGFCADRPFGNFSTVSDPHQVWAQF